MEPININLQLIRGGGVTFLQATKVMVLPRVGEWIEIDPFGKQAHYEVLMVEHGVSSDEDKNQPTKITVYIQALPLGHLKDFCILHKVEA